MDKSILRNVVGCSQNRNPLLTFLLGQFYLQKFQEIVFCGVSCSEKKLLQKFRKSPFLTGVASLQSAICGTTKSKP